MYTQWLDSLMGGVSEWPPWRQSWQMQYQISQRDALYLQTSIFEQTFSSVEFMVVDKEHPIIQFDLGVIAAAVLICNNRLQLTVT